MLELKNVKVTVENNEIIKSVDLTVNKGEIHALVGPNGSGKSSLANAIVGKEIKINFKIIRFDHSLKKLNIRKIL